MRRRRYSGDRATPFVPGAARVESSTRVADTFDELAFDETVDLSSGPSTNFGSVLPRSRMSPSASLILALPLPSNAGSRQRARPRQLPVTSSSNSRRSNAKDDPHSRPPRRVRRRTGRTRGEKSSVGGLAAASGRLLEQFNRTSPVTGPAPCRRASSASRKGVNQSPWQMRSAYCTRTCRLNRRDRGRQPPWSARDAPCVERSPLGPRNFGSVRRADSRRGPGDRPRAPRQSSSAGDQSDQGHRDAVDPTGTPRSNESSTYRARGHSLPDLVSVYSSSGGSPHGSSVIGNRLSGPTGSH